MISLRPYQRVAIDALYNWFYQNKVGNPLLVLPTGAGKSVILANLVKETFEQWPNQRILILTHVKELIEQNAAKLHAAWPDAPIGIYSAGLGRRDTGYPILLAGIQSVYNKANEIGDFNLIIIDECHLVSDTYNSRYRSLLNNFQSSRVVGLTATPWRMKSGGLIYGERALFNDIAYEINIPHLINEGYLAPLIPPKRGIKTCIDTSSLHVKDGEFIKSEMESLIDKNDVTTSAINEVVDLASDRKSWLFFCIGVDHAQHVAKALNARGIKAGCITSKTNKDERSKLIEQYRSGEIRALTNANVLTTGFDAPTTDLLVFLRPTHSQGLYVQMMGRGMRPSPGKINCLVLDFAGNIQRFGVLDHLKAWRPVQKINSREKEEKEVEITEKNKKIHGDSADDSPILSNQVQNFKKVGSISYRKHIKPGAKTPYSLRVDYYSGNPGTFLKIRLASEWICFEHDGYPKIIAEKWWRRHCNLPIPSSIDEALAKIEFIKKPSAIKTKLNGKFIEVVDYAFDE